MNDIVDKRANRDWATIFLNEDWQVKYWATRFHVTEAELRQATLLVGNRACDVQKYFGVQSRGRWKVRDPELKKY